MDIIKAAYVDIGELGYSLHLSAHLRWLKENTNSSLAVITTLDRKCLYRDSADLILDVPDDFYEKFRGKQSGLGLYPQAKRELREYFQRVLPSGYAMPENFTFDCSCRFFSNRVIYKPHTYSKKLEGRKKILIFPRCRDYLPFSRRNLPELFYAKLIEALCDEFCDYEIETIGLTSGSYNIEVDKDNYTNGVGEKVDLQDVIDKCQLAVNAIGSQSALPKLALLQGVSTFMIGHQQDRHINKENWLKTDAGFYEIFRNAYARFNFEECIIRIILFIKGERNGKSQIRLTEGTVQSYWRRRAATDGMRAVGHSGYPLKEQILRLRRLKVFIFSYCPRNLKTLDYGCGWGGFATEFEDYLGVDFTDSLLDIAKKRHEERCPTAHFLLLHSPYLNCDLDFNPELIFTANVLQHNPDDLVLKIFKSFIPIVKSDIMFGLYENVEAQSGHMRGRTGKRYAEMIEKYFKVYEWESATYIQDEKHAFTLIKAGRR